MNKERRIQNKQNQIQQLKPPITPVSLLGISGINQPKQISRFSRILANGENIPFRIPEGRLFIVTDIEYEFGDVPANAFVSLTITVAGFSVFLATTTANTEGSGGKTDILNSGIAVSSNGNLMVFVNIPVSSFVFITLHEYYKNQ